MRCPSLAELPPPPDKTGWPWTEESPQLPVAGTDGSAWPRISIVTPNYNHAQYLEETIRSVLLQGYPNLEYIVEDGGSTDGSVDIIRKYGPWLTHWESASDRGQSHALNKGFAHASGELQAWLNSSDCYLPGALAAFARLRARCADAVLLSGACQLLHADGRRGLQVPLAEGFLDFLDPARNARKPSVYQPALMWCGKRAGEVGPLDEADHMTMDVDLVLRLLELDNTAACMSTPVARVRFHEGQKSSDAMAAMTAIRETQCRHFRRVKHRLPRDEQERIARHLRIALAELDLHRFSNSGWADVAALVRSFMRDPRLVSVQTWTKVRTLWKRAQ